MAKASKEILYPYFKNQTNRIIEIANGIDFDEVVSEQSDRVSISTTTTLVYDYDDIIEINKELKTIAKKISKEIKTNIVIQLR